MPRPTVSGTRRRRPGTRTSKAYREENLRRRYGLTVADYEALLTQQNGVCAICGKACPTRGRLSVDHDHATGEVRGLACHKCNTALGLFDDNPTLLRAAAAYLETAPIHTPGDA